MRPNDAIRHFGSQAQIARLLGIERQAVNQWRRLVPYQNAKKLERLSGGKLRLDREMYLPR